MSKGFCYLKQSEFGANCVGGFQELRKAGELLDVTLACGDESIDVHKLVLSASSPFFRKILTNTTQNHPYIYIKGLNFQDLLCIINFVYNGEVQIPAADISRFIETAQELQIKGLGAEEIKGVAPPVGNDIKTDKSASKKTKLLKRKTNSQLDVVKEASEADNSNLYEIVGDDSAVNYSFDTELLKINKKLAKMKKRKIDKINEIKETLEEQYNPNDTLDSVLPVEAGDNYEITFGEVNAGDASDDSAMIIDGSSITSEQNAQLDLEISMRMGKIRDSSNYRMWKCKVCGKIGRNKLKLSRHVESHLTGFSHCCNDCNKTFKTRNSLHTHISTNHRK